MSDVPPPSTIKPPPRGLAIWLLVGPSLIWCAEYIGSGEVILATRTGAVLGTGVLWAIAAGILLKFWIGMSGARYTVTTGEGMIDLFARMPGPKNWAIWIVLVAQLVTAIFAIASIASAAGAFLSSLVGLDARLGGWLVTIFAVAVVWSGTFDILKLVMSVLVAITVLGVLYVAVHVVPDAGTLLAGLIPSAPEVPAWAQASGASANPWAEILPLLGWGAGGFASQVWYSYWVLGAGYGAAAGRGYGRPADTERLRSLTRDDAARLQGWSRVVYADASLAATIGIVVTCAFLLAGAGILRPQELAPEGPEVAITLSTLFADRWGELGGLLFMLGGAVALVATQIGQLAGWPRLLADACRHAIPGFAVRFTWKQQFRGFLTFFFLTSMVVVYWLGLRPVFLVKMGALFDGLLLTPLQAIWVAVGLFVVMPRLFRDDVRDLVRPHWTFAVGLGLAFLVFGYFCLAKMPEVLFG